MLRIAVITLICLSPGAAVQAQTEPPSLALFEDQTDVGSVLHPGSAAYDKESNSYTVTGSGANMWSASDEFHFVWKKVSATDLTLTAAISILGEGGDPHRKAVLMIRQSLDGDSTYVDAARHGEGLTSLQFREQKGGTTREVESNVSAPARLRLEKQGDFFYLWIAPDKGDFQFAGGSAKVRIEAPYYVGIGVCAHRKEAVEKALFKDVDLKTAVIHPAATYSTIETVLLSGDARTGYVSTGRLTSPGWSSDGRSLTFVANGKAEEAPFHPLRTAAPVGAPVAPSAENKFIFTSLDKGARPQIWRAPAAGGPPEQITSDDSSNVAPHLSPDGKYVLFLSYKGEDAALRILSVADSTIKTLTHFTGGPDSLGSQPWSPDGRRIVFVSYQTMK